MAVIPTEQHGRNFPSEHHCGNFPIEHHVIYSVPGLLELVPELMPALLLCISPNVLEWSPLLVHQKKNSAGQRKEEHQVVHHVQGEHHQSYFSHKHLGHANSVQEGPNAVVFCALTAIPKFEA